MRPLGPGFMSYTWAASTREIAELSGLDPIEVLRFDANVPASPPRSARPGALAAALSEVNTYPHGGYTELVRAIAAYAGVDPENVVLGAGSDDLILLTARAFAGPGDCVAITSSPTYPMFEIGAALAGADRSAHAEPAVTFLCRPNNPTGTLDAVPEGRPLVVDEAYFEYCADTVVDRIDEGIIVLRTFSKAFGLAGGRVGYALASRDVAAELKARQNPAPISTLSASLAIAALADPPDVKPQVEERERLADGLRSLGLETLPSWTNFVYAPTPEAASLQEALLRKGLAVRKVADGIRISVRTPEDDDALLEAIARILDKKLDLPPSRAARRTRRVRATAETRIAVQLDLDGSGRVLVDTGAGLYDHLFEQLAFHAGFDIVVRGAGDLETGAHHTVEDTALAIGEAIDSALGRREGIARFGDAVVPMDDALARAAVDLGGRRWSEIRLEVDPGMALHALTSFAHSARLALHVHSDGRDPHHVAEAAFKAVGRSLRAAIAANGGVLPSTKGLL